MELAFENDDLNAIYQLIVNLNNMSFKWLEKLDRCQTI